MVDNEDVSKKFKVLENLKNAVLSNYLDEINIGEELDFYDNLVRHFVCGNLDDYFDSYVFDNMSNKTKKDILNVIHNYQNLCFYNDNPIYWIDSVSDIPVEDYNLIIYQLLDNFDFLIKMFIVGGEKSLKLFENYAKSKYRDRYLSAVESIRRNFVNDDILFEVFNDISDPDTMFDVFTDNEKNILLEYPEGVLYFYDNGEIKITDSLLLSLELYFRINGESYNLDNRSDFIQVASQLSGFFMNEDEFEKNVIDMFFEYQEKLGLDSHVVMNDEKILKGLNRDDLRDNWIIQNQSLLERFDNPSTKNINIFK